MRVGLIILEVDHSMAPACLVERMQDNEASLFNQLVALTGRTQINQVFFFPNLCRRTEVVVCAPDPVAACESVMNTVTRVASLRADDWTAFRRYVDEDAILHLLSVAAGADGEGAAAQLQLCSEQSQRSGVGARILREVAKHAKVIPCSTGRHPESAESFRSVARQLWIRVQAEAALPECTKIRNEVDSICAEEIATFRSRCGGLMTEEQERAVKIVTARISERVGEWITRAWSDSAASRQHPSGGRNS